MARRMAVNAFYLFVPMLLRLKYIKLGWNCHHFLVIKLHHADAAILNVLSGGDIQAIFTFLSNFQVHRRKR